MFPQFRRDQRSNAHSKQRFRRSSITWILTGVVKSGDLAVLLYGTSVVLKEVCFSFKFTSFFSAWVIKCLIVL